MTELKHCPFCGGEIVLTDRILSIESTVTEGVCKGCGMVFKYRQYFAFSRKSRVAIDDSFEEVWNRRYTPHTEIDFDYGAEED